MTNNESDENYKIKQDVEEREEDIEFRNNKVLIYSSLVYNWLFFSLTQHPSTKIIFVYFTPYNKSQ